MNQFIFPDVKTNIKLPYLNLFKRTRLSTWCAGLMQNQLEICIASKHMTYNNLLHSMNAKLAEQIGGNL